ncbi:hypothetical protein [Varibaculum sp.]|uniref:DUF7455 domain-containing protein n=1 Tax=Varibaculum sp. TaxID=1895474 RepID=UPI00344A05A7
MSVTSARPQVKIENMSQKNYVFTSADRCDTCGAQAWVLASLNSGNLFFCAHHANTLVPALRQAGAEIIDNTSQLHLEEAENAPLTSLSRAR